MLGTLHLLFQFFIDRARHRCSQREVEDQVSFDFQASFFFYSQWRAKQRATVSEAMILATLAAYIGGGSGFEIRDQGSVEVAAKPLAASTTEVDADDSGLMSTF